VVAPSLVFWDTNLFIYSFERHPLFADRVDQIRVNMLRLGYALCTSMFTVGEALVKPASLGDRKMVEGYRSLFHSRAITLIPFDYAAAEAYSQIRSDKRISRPDAIQLACAASRGVNLFITNDQRLSSKMIPGIGTITSLDAALL
jgi:predicted nucleic acid-binding protein